MVPLKLLYDYGRFVNIISVNIIHLSTLNEPQQYACREDQREHLQHMGQ